MTATGAIAEAKPASTRSKRRRKVPDYLVKDEIDGVKFYYCGYKEVLNKTKQAFISTLRNTWPPRA